MNNFKKIGVSALAGSLVAFAANAGELSVSGTANLTYTSEEIGPTASSANNDGNPFGHASDVAFNGSGDMNGMTVSFFAALDAGGGGYASNSISLDMGDMGKLSYNDTDGHPGLAGLEDFMPMAYEQANDGLGTAAKIATMAKMASGPGFGYSTSVSGASISIGYFFTALGGLLGVRVLTSYLTPSQYGELSLAITMGGVVYSVFFGPLINGITRFFPIAREKKELTFYLFNVLNTIIKGILQEMHHT